MSDRCAPCGSPRPLPRRFAPLALALGLSVALSGGVLLTSLAAFAQSLGLPPIGGGPSTGAPGGFTPAGPGGLMQGGGVQMPGAAAPPPPQAAAPSGIDCQGDINKLSQKRIAQIDQLNALAKASKGKLDPVAACPKFRSLVAAEKEFESYMIKNKEWCGIPDDVIENVKTGTARDVGVGKQACALAAQVERAKKQQALGGGPGAPPAAQRLPAGPL